VVTRAGSLRGRGSARARLHHAPGVINRSGRGPHFPSSHSPASFRPTIPARASRSFTPHHTTTATAYSTTPKMRFATVFAAFAAVSSVSAATLNGDLRALLVRQNPADIPSTPASRLPLTTR
jgi:hypothetical protein